MAFVREIELRGHIVDSGVFGRVLEIIMDDENARYTIDNFVIGKTELEESSAALRIEADSRDVLDALLDKLRDIGAIVADDSDVVTEPAPSDGVLPDTFYATTNLETEVRVAGNWLAVALPEMDCAIVVGSDGARTTAPFDVLAGDAVVVGHEGVRVQTPQRSRRRQVFEFMSSAVSSEKPKESLVAEIARELRATLESGKRVLLVGGPAIVHTGAGKYLARLIRDGYIDALFAGNALAVHDIESQFYGTSLGVDLDDAFPVEEGHVHHLRTVNRIRADGGIANAIASGRLRGGIMYEAFAKKIPVVLAGSIRDDGPLPDVITDAIAAQARDAGLHSRDRHGAHGVHALALDRRRQSVARELQSHQRRYQSRERHEAHRSRHDAYARARYGRGIVLTRAQRRARDGSVCESASRVRSVARRDSGRGNTVN